MNIAFALLLATNLAGFNQYHAEIDRVIDGDTVVVSIAKPFRWRGDLRIHLRLSCIDAPETRGAAKRRGKESKAFVEDLVQVSKKWTLHTRLGHVDQYGRHIGGLTVETSDGDTVDLARLVAQSGHAKWTCEGTP